MTRCSSEPSGGSRACGGGSGDASMECTPPTVVIPAETHAGKSPGRSTTAGGVVAALSASLAALEPAVEELGRGVDRSHAAIQQGKKQLAESTCQQLEVRMEAMVFSIEKYEAAMRSTDSSSGQLQ